MGLVRRPISGMAPVISEEVAMETRPAAALEEPAIQDFKATLRGELIRPGDETYDRERVLHNAMIDRRPGLIVRCAGTADVMSAVDFARRNRLLVAVRGGGHNVTGNAVCDDGIVIDLSRMKGLRIDPVARTASVEPGITWGELNHDLQAFGLGATGGYVSITGVPGLTLGGGFGWLVRKHGLAMDNLLSVDVVTADGRLRTASATENADLFWGVRGAGANFGVVTSFEFRVHPVGTVLAGPIIHPLARGREVLRLFREHVPSAPDELTWGVLLFTVPESPMFPPPLHRAQVIVPAVCWAGPLEAGEEFLRPIRAFGPPIADLVEPMPYSAAQIAADFLFPPGLRNYWKSSFLRELSDAAIDTLVEHFAKVPSQRTVMILDHNGGGAISRVGATDTAYGHRSWTYNLVVISAWADAADDERNMGWARALWSAMRPFLANAVYVNYTSDQGAETIRDAYPPAVRERLVALKNQYDPTNLFRMNHNILPTAA
jgi:FAD/FMN-containing dehydrogenase